MIMRIWRGKAANAADAETYRRHLADVVFPGIATLAGHRGAVLLTGPADGGIEVLAVTFWDSPDAITAFAGPEPGVAVVEPAARAVLCDFDAFVRHYDVTLAVNGAEKI